MFHDTHPCLYRRIPGTRVDDFLLFASVIIKQNVGPLPPPPFPLWVGRVPLAARIEYSCCKFVVVCSGLW